MRDPSDYKPLSWRKPRTHLPIFSALLSFPSISPLSLSPFSSVLSTPSYVSLESLNHSGNIASSSSSTHVNGHVADRSVSPNLAGPNQNGTSQAGPSGVNGHHMVETTNDRYTEYLQSHSTIFPPEQHQQQNGRSHKKTASGGGEEEKGPVLEEIIDGISSGLVLHGENGDGVEDDQESSLKRYIHPSPPALSFPPFFCFSSFPLLHHLSFTKLFAEKSQCHLHHY